MKHSFYVQNFDWDQKGPINVKKYHLTDVQNRKNVPWLLDFSLFLLFDYGKYLPLLLPIGTLH